MTDSRIGGEVTLTIALKNGERFQVTGLIEGIESDELLAVRRAMCDAAQRVGVLEAAIRKHLRLGAAGSWGPEPLRTEAGLSDD